MLDTFYQEKFAALKEIEENEDLLNIVLKTGSDPEFEYQYLINVRVIAALLANVFWNQIRILVRERVNYERKFDYEEYI